MAKGPEIKQKAVGMSGSLRHFLNFTARREPSDRKFRNYAFEMVNEMVNASLARAPIFSGKSGKEGVIALYDEAWTPFQKDFSQKHENTETLQSGAKILIDSALFPLTNEGKEIRGANKMTDVEKQLCVNLALDVLFGPIADKLIVKGTRGESKDTLTIDPIYTYVLNQLQLVDENALRTWISSNGDSQHELYNKSQSKRFIVEMALRQTAVAPISGLRQLIIDGKRDRDGDEALRTLNGCLKAAIVGIKAARESDAKRFPDKPIEILFNELLTYWLISPRSVLEFLSSSPELDPDGILQAAFAKEQRKMTPDDACTEFYKQMANTGFRDLSLFQEGRIELKGSNLLPRLRKLFKNYFITTGGKYRYLPDIFLTFFRDVVNIANPRLVAPPLLVDFTQWGLPEANKEYRSAMQRFLFQKANEVYNYCLSSKKDEAVASARLIHFAYLLESRSSELEEPKEQARIKFGETLIRLYSDPTTSQALKEAVTHCLHIVGIGWSEGAIINIINQYKKIALQKTDHVENGRWFNFMLPLTWVDPELVYNPPEVNKTGVAAYVIDATIEVLRYLPIIDGLGRNRQEPTELLAQAAEIRAALKRLKSFSLTDAVGKSVNLVKDLEVIKNVTTDQAQIDEIAALIGKINSSSWTGTHNNPRPLVVVYINQLATQLLKSGSLTMMEQAVDLVTLLDQKRLTDVAQALTGLVNDELANDARSLLPPDTVKGLDHVIAEAEGLRTEISLVAQTIENVVNPVNHGRLLELQSRLSKIMGESVKKGQPVELLATLIQQGQQKIHDLTSIQVGMIKSTQEGYKTLGLDILKEVLAATNISGLNLSEILSKVGDDPKLNQSGLGFFVSLLAAFSSGAAVAGRTEAVTKFTSGLSAQPIADILETSQQAFESFIANLVQLQEDRTQSLQQISAILSQSNLEEARAVAAEINQIIEADKSFSVNRHGLLQRLQALVQQSLETRVAVLEMKAEHIKRLERWGKQINDDDKLRAKAEKAQQNAREGLGLTIHPELPDLNNLFAAQ